MYLKEQKKITSIITTSNEKITNEQADELLWKVIYYDKEGEDFVGFTPNHYGNAIYVWDSKENKIINKSKRPIIPFYYDDKYFYCWSLQGADEYKKPPKNLLKKHLYFLPKSFTGMPKKDSYIHLDKIIKIDKKYLYNAIDKNHLRYINTKPLGLKIKTKILTKVINAIKNWKMFFEIHTLIIKRNIIDKKTNEHKEIENLKSLPELHPKNENWKYLNMSVVEYVGEEKLKSKVKNCSYNKNWYNVEKFHKKHLNSLIKKLNPIEKFCKNILFNELNSKILNAKTKEKEKWFKNLNETENLKRRNIEQSDEYNKKSRKIVLKRFDNTVGVNILEKEQIKWLKDFIDEYKQNSYKEQTLKNKQNLKENNQSENDKNHLKRIENEYKNKNAIGFDNANKQKEILDKKNEQVKNDDQKKVIEKENKTKENNETNKQVLLNDIEHNQKKEMEKQQKDKLMKENKKLDDNAKNKDEQLKKEQKEKDELKRENEKLKNKKNEEEKKKEEKDKKKVIVKPKKKNNLNITKKSTSNKKKLKQNLDETRKTRNQKEKELKNENNKNNIQKLKKDIRELKVKEQRISIELDKLENKDDEKEEKSKGNERERSLFD